ncbi:MAG: Na(+)/H(+) antiporter subunit B [Spirochaetales bacterium]|nr:Na(+)/H(+) antiporter subunit B [Spirochaetales bacterium]
MIQRMLIILVLILMGFGIIPLVWGLQDAETVSPVSQYYVSQGADDLGAANLVTAVVVSYRGLDTLGEVAVLFTATAGAAMLLGLGADNSKRKQQHQQASEKPGNHMAESEAQPKKQERREGSELLKTGAAFLFPLLLVFGVYIFIHGHLTPGGGFQGGVVIASGLVLLLLSESDRPMRKTLLHSIESLSGAAYAAVGLMGLWLAAGFLDPRFLPAGQFGSLFSAGAIPVIYSLIGLKVGSELTGVIDSLRRRSS